MTSTLPLCPKCNARLLPDAAGDKLWCQFCGTDCDDPAALKALETHRTTRAEEKTAYHPPSRDWDMDPDLREGLDDAWDSIQRHDPKSARFTLRYM
ncbi:MAG: hypothetical protein HY866_00225, partial [Chloroflexi bacterium]|nr:hypothetical protein [Chloroflexota bacterium]